MPPAPIPDRPQAFGYKQIWLAVKDREPAEVAESLGLDRCRPANWEEGIDRAYESHYDKRRGWHHSRIEIFVSPPVRGWTLAVGGILALPSLQRGQAVSWLESLSERLGEVQLFETHRIVDHSAWAKADRGRVIRVFAHSDGDRFEFGQKTPEEIELGFDFLDESRATPEEIAAHEAKMEAEFRRSRETVAELRRLRAEAKANGQELDRGIYDEPRFQSHLDLLSPSEQSVMQIAGRWSLDPTRLDEIEAEPGLGLLGSIRRR